MKHTIRNKRGSATLEAAVVLPFVILSVFTCILLCCHFAQTVTMQTQLHLTLRQQAGQLTGTSSNITQGNDNFQCEQTKHGIFYRIAGEAHRTMNQQALLHHRVDTDLMDLWHASDGVSYVRYCTITRRITEFK